MENSEELLLGILSKYKKMFFISYNFMISHEIIFVGKELQVKLMYKNIYYPTYKYKLIRIPTGTNMEKEIANILFDVYHDYMDHKLLPLKQEVSNHWKNLKKPNGILKITSNKSRKTVTFNLPPIEEKHQSLGNYSTLLPVRRFVHRKLQQHLVDPRKPESPIF